MSTGATLPSLRDRRTFEHQRLKIMSEHERAMLLFKRSQSSQITEYAPIAKALSSLDPTTESKLKRKYCLLVVLGD